MTLSAHSAGPLTPTGRIFAAQKHRKALRRYQHALESGRLKSCFAESFEFLSVKPIADQFYYAPDSPRLLMPVVVIAGAKNRHYVSEDGGGTGGADEWGSETPNRWVASDATGTDNGQSINAPWTMAQAMANGAAGHIIGLLAGSGGGYTGSNTGSNSVPSFYLANDGTSGSRIKVVSQWCSVYHSSNRTQLSNGVTSGNGSVAGSACPTFGPYLNQYVDWIGPFVDESTSRSLSDTGPVVIWFSSNCTLQKLFVDCVSIDRVDNHNGIRVQESNDCTCQDIRVTGCTRSDVRDQNSAAFMCYDAERIVFEYIETDDCDVAFFPKGVHSGNLGGITIRYTKNTNVHWCGIRMGGVGTVNTDQNVVSDNLVVAGSADANLPYGIEGKSYDSISPKRLTIEYNTVVGFARGVQLTHSGGGTSDCYTSSSVANNILSGCTQVAHAIAADATARTRMAAVGFTMDNDHIHDSPNIGNLNALYEDGGTAYSTMSAWRSATTYDDNTTEGDPLFTNAAGGDYSLQGGSPAAGKGFRATPGVRAG